MLVYVFIKPTYPTTAESQLLLNQQFIFSTFLQITSELKDIVFYSKRPIGSFFHALLHETIKFFYCQCPLMQLNLG